MTMAGAELYFQVKKVKIVICSWNYWLRFIRLSYLRSSRSFLIFSESENTFRWMCRILWLSFWFSVFIIFHAKWRMSVSCLISYCSYQLWRLSCFYLICSIIVTSALRNFFTFSGGWPFLWPYCSIFVWSMSSLPLKKCIRFQSSDAFFYFLSSSTNFWNSSLVKVTPLPILV